MTFFTWSSVWSSSWARSLMIDSIGVLSLRFFSLEVLSSEYLPSSSTARGSSPPSPVTFCTHKKSPKNRQGGFAPSGLPHSSWAGGARESLPYLDSSLPLNCCALPWQDWQNVKLRLPALHVEVPAELRSGCAMRTRQEEQARPHHAGGPVVSSKNRAARRRTQR